MTEEMKRRVIQTNRIAETVAFLIGVFALATHVVVDQLMHLGFRIGPCVPEKAEGIPWGIIIVSIVLIVPKTIGRATAGQAILAGINAITLRLTGRGAATATVSAQSPDGGDAKPIAAVSLPSGGGTAVTTVMAPATAEHPVDVDLAAETARAGKAIES